MLNIKKFNVKLNKNEGGVEFIRLITIDTMKIGNKNFDIGKRTYIMGILNVTPDSFSDGGNYISKENAIERAKEMVEHGADIIDVGGQSTRPNHKPIQEIEEINRVIPIIRAIKSEIDIPISIDTYKARVAELAVVVSKKL